MFIYQTALKDQYYDKVIDLYVNKHLSSRRISAVIPLSKTTIMRWIANFAEENPEVPVMSKRTIKPKKVTVDPAPRQELPDEVQALQAELARVKEELRKEKLRADAYDTMIDIAEDIFKVPIRKKAGAKR
ncbi:MAG: helix-turn-helix domain-containing protein [Bacteroidales bacterium]|nr:helix-turn-helix domain-containing protein [Bacteroidales bacterium]